MKNFEFKNELSFIIPPIKNIDLSEVDFPHKEMQGLIEYCTDLSIEISGINQIMFNTNYGDESDISIAINKGFNVIM